MRWLALALLTPTLAFSQGLTTRRPGQAGSSVTNQSLQSSTITASTSPVSPWTDYSCTYATPGGGWSQITNIANDGAVYQDLTVPASTTFLYSVYAKKSSGTGVVTLRMNCKTGTAACVGCWTSDGSACSASVVTTGCTAKFTAMTTTEIRVAVAATCSGAITVARVSLCPGDSGVATGVAQFTGSQLEITTKTIPGKLCNTTTAAKTCK